MNLKETVKRAGVMLALLLLLMGISRGMSAQEEMMQAEEAIVYENDVIQSIEAQLQGMDRQALRAHAPLIMERDIADIQAAIERKELSYQDLTAFYLDRIARYDKSERGINAVIQVNPRAMEEARKLDEAAPREKGPLYGIPVLLKDNINTRDMATSAGTLALKDFVPAEDAPVVQQLKAQQAIILGKANLSELANFVDLNMPNGYSSRLGQTRNPHAPGFMSPLGSSAGSAAAVAANLAAVSLGTETTGSIIAPSSIHSLVGYKPSLGAISTQGVLPLSSSLDTLGPIAKSMKDAVTLYNAAVTKPEDQVSLKEDASLAGKRIGVLKGENSGQLAAALSKLGAVPVELNWSRAYFGNDEIITGEFARDYAAYAAAFHTPVKTLQNWRTIMPKTWPGAPNTARA